MIHDSEDGSPSTKVGVKNLRGGVKACNKEISNTIPLCDTCRAKLETREEVLGGDGRRTVGVLFEGRRFLPEPRFTLVCHSENIIHVVVDEYIRCGG